MLKLYDNLRLGWKGLPGTNALAYYKKSTITAVKSFITLAPGLMFVGKARSLPYSGAPERCFIHVFSGIIRLGWKGLPGTNALAYYKKVMTYVHKKFYNIGLWSNVCG